MFEQPEGTFAERLAAAKCASYGCGHRHDRHVVGGGAHPCLDCFHCRGFVDPELEPQEKEEPDD